MADVTPVQKPVPAPQPLIKWQAPMTQVLYALVPIVLAGIYFFGWRVLVIVAAANAAGFLTEYLFLRAARQPVTSAVFVTNTLFALSLTPALPIWMVVVGAMFAVAFGKMMFGGFGRNVFNPALVGRAFLYVSFGNFMTAEWAVPFSGGAAGFAAYAQQGADAMTTATPGMLLKTGATFGFRELVLGIEPGTIGGTSAILTLVCGLYIIWKKAANWRLALSAILGFVLVQTGLWLGHVKGAAEPLHTLLSGSFLFGAFFFATEPVTASKHALGRWIYGAFIGVMSSVIGVFSAWPAGTMFAILLANMFTPIMDYGLKQWDLLRKPALPANARTKG
jgi:Na+-transporting NADH:ubiquinone oxidoreductase subunit B